MIKLNISSKEMNALSQYAQICISIAEKEMISGMDMKIYEIEGGSRMMKWQFRNPDDKTANALKVAELHMHINEFKNFHQRMEKNYDHRFEHKQKTIDITKPEGYFYLIYIIKAENARGIIKGIRIKHIMPIVKTQATEILKNFI